MSYITASIFDAVVDEVISRISNNLSGLGLGGVEERAEDPAVMDKVRQHGSWCYVIPLAEGRDRMDIMQSSTGQEMYHNFSFNITAYFNSTSLARSSGGLTSPLRATRDNAFNLVDLFNDSNNNIGSGYVYRVELEQGYYEITDQIITTYNIKFYVKLL